MCSDAAGRHGGMTARWLSLTGYSKFIATVSYAQPMSSAPTTDPILNSLRASLTAVYGDRLSRVVLYGSRARGDAKPDSDYDIAVFLRNRGSFADENARLAELTTDILLATDAVINAIPLSEEAYAQQTGFMHELRTDGIEL
jgi:uncharacterized protein